MKLTKFVFVTLLSFAFLLGCQKDDAANPDNDAGTDFATQVAGSYEGVLVTATGINSSYTITITRTGKNEINVTGEDSEFKSFTVKVESLKHGSYDWIVEVNNTNSVKGITYSRPDGKLNTHDDVNDVQFSGDRMK